MQWLPMLAAYLKIYLMPSHKVESKELNKDTKIQFTLNFTKKKKSLSLKSRNVIARQEDQLCKSGKYITNIASKCFF